MTRKILEIGAIMIWLLAMTDCFAQKKNMEEDILIPYEDDGIKLLRKSYIVKKNFLSTEKLHKELSSFCYDYYDNQSEFDEIDFDFYRECPEMPWFWNNDGYFYDLETNWDNLVAVYGIGKEGLAFRVRKTFFSKEIFGRSPPLYQTEEERE